ncbi:hypothetical protein HY404_02895 [Candidatus Microgenomates bacterium]|nr:hypothetical protein [Candidatus Microgenomates bacterium]
MSVLSNKNKSISHKLKRAIAFKGWRRHISGKEKLIAKESRNFDINNLLM